MTLAEFVRGIDGEERTVLVLNRTEPEPVQEMLLEAFDPSAVTVTESETPTGHPEDAVLLLDGDRPIAASDLVAIRDGLLQVNSDLYITGARSIGEIDTPEVLARLTDVRMRAEGYPSPEKQKLLLIEISRHIEQRAWRVGAGTLRSGFQRLSRIDDETGTREVYERLSDTDLDVHVYGLPDWSPSDRLDLVAHSGDPEQLREVWFVIYRPPRDPQQAAALVAVQVEGNEWEAFWTYDPDRVAEVDRYVRTTF